MTDNAQIVLCIPTRHRPLRIRETLKSINETVQDYSAVQIAIYVDNDDTMTHEQTLQEEFKNLNILCVRGDRVDGSERYNILADKTKANILGYFADDVIFISTAWEKQAMKLFDEISDQILLINPWNGNSPRLTNKKATHGFVSRKSTEIVGTFFPHGFIEFFHDSWLTEVYSKLGRIRSSHKISVVHKSFRVERTLKDDIYKRGDAIMPNGRTLMDNMQELYLSYDKVKEREMWVEKLKGYILNAS